MIFDTNGIVGQQNILSNLELAINNDRVGHAYIFSGADGMGKRTIAKRFALALLCTSEDKVPCGICEGCRTFYADTNPDFYVIDVDSDSIKIDEIRQMLSDVYVRPMYSTRKVYLIVNADKMTVQAQNCLLKTLEDPPDFATIILTSAHYDALLETIRSRLTKVEFATYSSVEIAQAIKIDFPEFEKIGFAITFSNGNIGRALMICGNERFLFIRDKIFDIIVGMLNGNNDKNLELLTFLDENKEDIDTILDILQMVLRDFLVIIVSKNDDGQDCVLINSDKKDIMISNLVNKSSKKIINCIDLIEKVRAGMNQNVNYSLAIEYLTMQMQEEIF